MKKIVYAKFESRTSDTYICQKEDFTDIRVRDFILHRELNRKVTKYEEVWPNFGLLFPV